MLKNKILVAGMRKSPNHSETDFTASLKNIIFPTYFFTPCVLFRFLRFENKNSILSLEIVNFNFKHVIAGWARAVNHKIN